MDEREAIPQRREIGQPPDSYYHDYVKDPAYTPTVNEKAEDVRITIVGPGFSSNDGRNFQFNPPAVPPPPAPEIIKLPDFSLSDGGSSKLAITNGTIANALPTDMIAGGFPVFKLTVSTDGFAWLKVTIDATTSAITARAIEVGAAVPDDTVTIGYQALGEYSVVSGVIIVASGAVGIGSQRFLSCAGNHYFWRA